MKDLVLASPANPIEISGSNSSYQRVFESTPPWKYFFYVTNTPMTEGSYDFLSPYYSKAIRKEEFFVTAIKNLRKKINFIILNNEFQNGDITDIDFEKEIEENPDKYVVTVDNLQNEHDLEILHEVITKVNEHFSIDEISEVFSIDITGANLIRE